MVPAEKRLEAADGVRSEVDHRLVIELELAVAERTAQFGFKLPSRLHAGVHLLFKEAECAAPIRLGTVEGKIGTP